MLRDDARPLYDEIMGDGLPLVMLSAVGGLATLALVARRANGLARLTAALAVGALLWAWVVGQYPDLLPGELTVDEAAAGHSVMVALMVSVGLGVLVLGPSLAYLFRLVLAGRLDKDPAPEEPEGAPLP